MRNKAYFGTIAGEQEQQEDKRQDKRDGTHRKRAGSPAPPAPSGHDHRHKERATTAAPATPKN